MYRIDDGTSETRLRDLASDCWKEALALAERELRAAARERARTAQQIRHALGNLAERL